MVGEVTDHIVSLLEIVPSEDRKIYFAPSNLDHMKTSHPDDFAKYGKHLSYILAEPDYVGRNPADGSIEYVKEFFVDGEYVKEFFVDGEYVKVAVRLSHSERYFARTLYTLNKNRVKNFIEKGTLKKT
ncbi:PBECR2 nuclease fold domain-containing protein [Flintibacter hominis]|uniref:PBECR3 domain-containing polyvalent protein n=1 Tax=Flintibacter hominis TaxID=2763048 RepID=UPI00344E89F3